MQDANMKKAPSVRELSEKRTEGEKLALFKTLDKGNALSPTRLRGQTPLSLRDISPHCGESPTQRGPNNKKAAHRQAAGCGNYFAYSVARLSRMTLTLIWPG